jgi:4-oxalocrotonate tautomerase
MPVVLRQAQDRVIAPYGVLIQKFNGVVNMPYVNIRITEEGVTSEQKARLIEGVTSLLKEVLGKNPATTMVVIDEIPTDNWGVAGEQVSQRRKRGL